MYLFSGKAMYNNMDSFDTAVCLHLSIKEYHDTYEYM